jgi:FKBP-type peptidyl-prolyl cis-trans isomerase
MKRKIISFGMVVLVFTACTHFKKGEGDMPYEIIEDKSGETIKEGEVVELSVIATTEEDSVVWNSADYDRPALVKRERSLFKGDLFAALGLLSQGDSAVVRINIDSMKIKMGVPRPGSAKSRYLVYSMRIDHVVPKGQLPDSLYAAKVDKFLEARLEKLKNDEPARIKSFITSRHWDPVATGSGLEYCLMQKGTGPPPMPGDTMEVRYTGMLMSGKVVTSTFTPCKITYGMYDAIRGFNEMLMLMPKGAKAKAIIPSALAYGRKGQAEDMAIQAYTPLVYEIEMVNIIHPRSLRSGSL